MTNNLVPEMDSLPVCQGCALGKQHCAAIHCGSPAHCAATLLDLVSFDVIGPFPPSLQGSVYISTFTNSYSR